MLRVYFYLTKQPMVQLHTEKDRCLYSERKKFGGCAFGCRVRSWNKQIMGCYSRSVSSKREATFISLREVEMAVKTKRFIVSLWLENKSFLQKLLKDDCIYWRLEPVFEDKRVLRKDFGNVLKYVDREYWNGWLN